MFIGTYQHNLDPKNRIIMPAKFREELGDTFFVTKGLSGCLLAMPLEKWEAFVSKISARPAQESEKLQRFFCAGADSATPNQQGRFVIPDQLRSYAGIDKEVTIVGTGKQVEIWSSDKWEEISAQSSVQDIAELMKDISY